MSFQGWDRPFNASWTLKAPPLSITDNSFQSMGIETGSMRNIFGPAENTPTKLARGTLSALGLWLSPRVLGRPRMLIVQKTRQFLPQTFIALALMPGHNGVLEQLFLNGLRQLSPKHDDRRAQDLPEFIFLM